MSPPQDSPCPILSVHVGRNCGGLLTRGPRNSERERGEVRGPCREGGMSQEVMEIQRENQTISQAPPRSSPGPAPLDHAPHPYCPHGPAFLP